MQVSLDEVDRRGAGLITEAVLVQRVKSGSAQALAELYERHAGELHSLARRITGCSADAEDVLHDLFLGLPELLQRYEERGQLRAWLRQVTIRLALLRVRRTSRRAEVPLPDSASFGEESKGGVLDLRRALDLLPAPLRSVFVLKQIEGYSHREIAALLGITSGASRVRFIRAIRRLRTLLEPGS